VYRLTGAEILPATHMLAREVLPVFQRRWLIT
jgi:hypothetical protein